MAASFGWGTLAASSLVIGAIISNLPEAISSTSGLATAGWKSSRTLWTWIGIAVVSGLASLAGYAPFQHSPPDTVAFAIHTLD